MAKLHKSKNLQRENWQATLPYPLTILDQDFIWYVLLDSMKT